MQTSREDVGIAIRSAFLQKGTQQRFSLIALIIVSAFLLAVEKVKTKPFNYFRSIVKDTIYRGSLIISGPSKGVKFVVEEIDQHINLYNNYNQLLKENNILKGEISKSDYLTLENTQLRKLIDEQVKSESNLVSSRVMLEKKSPYLNSFVINSGSNRKIKNGETVPWSERGTSLIVIGGDKLSRGLTLEGLSVSYYLRASRMYDTLMQMGRWFGYKDGYIDLCRIFTTYDLTEWYRHIALANKQLSNEFDYMAMTGGTPENFGLKVLNHPGRLAVTAAGKMRSTEKIRISFSGRSMETIVFNPLHSNKNLNSLKKLINATGRDPDNGVSKNNSRLFIAYYLKNVRLIDNL